MSSDKMCRFCGSEDIYLEGSAKWDNTFEQWDWTVNNVYCNSCKHSRRFDCDSSVVERNHRYEKLTPKCDECGNASLYATDITRWLYDGDKTSGEIFRTSSFYGAYCDNCERDVYFSYTCKYNDD